MFGEPVCRRRRASAVGRCTLNGRSQVLTVPELGTVTYVDLEEGEFRMRSIYWNSLCTVAATTVLASTALAQDCANAPSASDGANPFATSVGIGDLAMPAGNGCAAAHTIWNVTYFNYTAAVSGSHTF